MKGDELSYTVSSLQRNKAYSVKVRMLTSYSGCRYTYTYGNYSETVMFRTNSTCKGVNIDTNNIIAHM